MRTLLTLLIIFAAPAATADTVLIYAHDSDKPPKAFDESATAAFVVEVQDGRVRWQELEYEEWGMFDPAGPTIREYHTPDPFYDEHDDHDEYANPDVETVVQRTVPKRLGKTRRNGHPCVMYSFDDQGVEAKTCLADAAAFGIPAEDAAALQAFADFAHRLRDSGLYTAVLPLGFSTVSGVGVWTHGFRLIKVEQRDLPRERFETPPGYERYVPDFDGL